MSDLSHALKRLIDTAHDDLIDDAISAKARQQKHMYESLKDMLLTVGPESVLTALAQACDEIGCCEQPDVPDWKVATLAIERCADECDVLKFRREE